MNQRRVLASTLVATMVLSVIGVGAAVALHAPDWQNPTNDNVVQRGGEPFRPAHGVGNVGDGATVFAGERDLTFGSTLSDTLTGVSGGGAEGEQLSANVEVTQQPGRYTNDGTSATPGLTVTEPDITQFQLVNEFGKELGSSASVQETQHLLVVADWDFKQAEDVALTIENEDGLQVQQGSFGSPLVSDLTSGQRQHLVDETQATTAAGATTNNLATAQQGMGNTGLGTNQVAAWNVSLSDLEAGSFTFQVQAIDDLARIDDAVQTSTVEVTSEDEPSIELQSTDATQGDRVTFSIENSQAGANHLVGIDLDDARDDITDQNTVNIFREVGDTQLIGTADADEGSLTFPGVNGYLNTFGDNDDEYVFANVSIDNDGIGQGQIDTAFLDDTSVDITLWEAGTQFSGQGNGVDDASNEVDETTLDVAEGEIELLNPGATYVPGQSVDVNGTAPSGMDAVSVYVRDQGDWYLLTESIAVESDGTFEEEDQQLSGEGHDAVRDQAANILGIPGIYRIGVIDDVDADAEQLGAASRGNEPDAWLNSSEFNSGASTQRSIRVALPTLTAEFTTYDGEIFARDGIDYHGTSIGPDEVVILFTGEKGNVAVESETVDDDDTFDQDQYGGISQLSEGRVLATALSTGRDGLFGDGTLTHQRFEPIFNQTSIEANVGNFVGAARRQDGQGRTLSQLVEIFRSETIEDAGSDDLLVSETFRLTDDSSTSIQDVVPATQPNVTGVNPIEVGETTLIRGVTNRNPEITTIVLEAINGTDANKIPVNTTDQWGTSGDWNMTLDIPTDVTPGNYTLQVSDGDTTDRAMVEIVAQGQRGNIAVGDTQQLQNQIQELQGQVQQLRDRNEQLNQTVSDLREENEDLESQIDSQDNDTDDTNDTDGEEGQPGFTPVVALIALVSAALIALRRR